MARAKICDLCETYYRPYNEDHIYPNTIKLISYDSGGYSKETEKYDLCPDCLVAIGTVIWERKHQLIDMMPDDLVALKKKFNLPVVESVEGE